jgi:hypothetical protein
MNLRELLKKIWLRPLEAEGKRPVESDALASGIGSQGNVALERPRH